MTPTPGIGQPVGPSGEKRHHAARQSLLLEELKVELLFMGTESEQADGQPFLQLERQIGGWRLDLGFAGRRRIE